MVKSLIVVGCGAIAAATIPIIVRYMPDDLKIIAIDAKDMDVDLRRSLQTRIEFHRLHLTPTNFRTLLEPFLGTESFLLNLSTGVSSVELIGICQETGTLYLDTCIEPWEGGYVHVDVPNRHVTNGFLRQQALDLRLKYPHGPTALLAHGANPGLISQFLKEALLLLTDSSDEDKGISHAAPSSPRCIPTTRTGWVQLAQSLGVTMIQIAEIDTQRTRKAFSDDTFVNTWSAHGFLSELTQPSEFGIGTHENHIQTLTRLDSKGPGAFFDAAGASVRVQTWTPEGPGEGYLVTHNESLSIADYFSRVEDGKLTYRPTVYYAYQPCEIAAKSIMRWQSQGMKDPACLHVLKPDEIFCGNDYLGVLIIRKEGDCFWYGSILSIEEAKRTSPFCSATTLQVAAGIYAAIRWVLANPRKGIIEAEDMDHTDVMQFATPLLGRMCGMRTRWHPRDARQDRSSARGPVNSTQLIDFIAKITTCTSDAEEPPV